MNLQKKRLFEFIHKLTLAIQHKKKYVTSSTFKNSDWLLYYLFEQRLIKNYKIDNYWKFTVDLAYDTNGNSVIRGIHQPPHAHYKHHTSLARLLRLKKGHTPYALFETRKGILPLQTCINLRIGGYLLLWID